MLVLFTVVPIGCGESLSQGVAEVIRLVDESGLPYKTNPMGTVVEGEWDEVMALVKKCHEGMKLHSPRVLTSLSIDDRPGKSDRMVEKIKSVENRLGRAIKQ